MKRIFIVIAILFLGVGWYIGKFYYANLRGARPAFGPVSGGITKVAENTTGLPLLVPSGFGISLFAKDLTGPRVLVWDPQGTLLTSIPSTGKVVALIDADHNGIAEQTEVVVENLNLPHGLAFYESKLYIAETNQVAVYDYDGVTHKASHKKKIVDLPGGGTHFSRTIAFGPDNKLYIAIGSTCNVCREKDSRRASILVANPDGSEVKSFASGLRNAVFFTWSPYDNRMWATVMGRDLLGDDIPPDTVDIVTSGKNFGWPYCYGNKVWDQSFDSSQKAKDFCVTTEGSHIDMQAHSAPLGLAFVPKMWPKAYQSSLLVALHGSWNRTEPTGYKVVRFRLDAQGNNLGVEDFITGWFPKGGGAGAALGRPVDLLFDPQGNLFISDDKAGVIYRLTLP